MSISRIVLTGGPSAGKTTLLNLLHKQYGGRIAVAPEAASILFNGGFPRPETAEDRLHTQRSIYTLQKELELQSLEKSGRSMLFCDRGSLDGFAYFHGSLKEFCFAMGTTLEREIDRYTAVIHLQTAEEGRGYTNTEVRLESPLEAQELDRKIGAIWSLHPGYVFVPNRGTFIDKLNVALKALQPYLPETEVLEPKYRYATAADLI
jgi:predicted ATPase